MIVSFQKVKEQHPFFVNNTWREAKDLKQGDSLFAYTGYKVALDSIFAFRTDTATAVYNLEADGNHNFYVSASGVLVHNQCKAGFTSFIKKLANGSAKMIEVKIPNGYTKVNGVFSEGAEVFYNGKNYISPDVYRHNGGVWKMAKKPSLLKSRGKRMGTYDANLNRIGD